MTENPQPQFQINETLNDRVQASSIFDFSEIFAATQQTYLPRPALEREVLDHLAGEPTGCCILLGEPGSGKTIFAASTIHTQKYLHHFLRQGHTEFTLWRDPYGFLTSLGFQLQSRYGDDLFPKSVAVDVHGRITEIAPRGEFTGVEIGQMVVVPFHSAAIQVNMEAGKVLGKATGLKIAELVEDYRSIPLQTYREMAFLSPLRRLKELHPEEKVVLWVDGLDEESMGLTTVSDGESISSLLFLSEELANLGNLALVISSRPNANLNRFIDSGARIVEMADPRFAADTAGLVSAFIERELTQPEVLTQIGSTGIPIDKMRKSLETICAGNLLYLYQFFQAVRVGALPELMTGGLPVGLDNIYTRILGRITSGVILNYLNDIHPIVSVLTITGQSLTVGQLAQFTGLNNGGVIHAIALLRPLLDTERIARESTYGFYHTSLRDCLTAETHSESIWYVHAPTAHSMIARYYLKEKASDWKNMDDYGFAFFPIHLARGEVELQDELFSLVDEPWRKARRIRDRGYSGFSRDIALAAECARTRPFPQAVNEIARLVLMDNSITEVLSQPPPGSLALMSRLGQVQRALSYIRQDMQPTAALANLAEILKGLSSQGESGRSLLYQTLKQGLNQVAVRPDHGFLANLLEACSPVNSPEMSELLQQAVEIFNRAESYWATPQALTELGRLFSVIQPAAGSQAFQQSLDAIQKFTRSSASREMARLFRYWSAFDPGEAESYLTRQELFADPFYMGAILSVYKALEQSGHTGSIEFAYKTLTQQFIPAISRPDDRAEALILLSKLEMEMGEPGKAAESNAQAVAAIEVIGTPEDPDHDVQNRRARATHLLASAAHIDVRIGQIAELPRARQVLTQAWDAIQTQGAWDQETAIRELVEAQIADNPDLFEIRLSRLGRSKLRAAMLVKAAEVEMPDDPALAEERLEEALRLEENPSSDWEGQGDFALEVARAMKPSDRENAQAVLESAYLSSETIVKWRMEVLRELMRGGDASAQSWLLETVKCWVATARNANYLAEFPAAAKDLPIEFITALAEQALDISSPVHRRLLCAALWFRLPRNEALAQDLQRQVLSKDESTGRMEQDDRPLMNEYQILGFAAGQAWDADRNLAERLLAEAFLEIESNPRLTEDPDVHETHLLLVLQNLLLGSSQAALPLLIAAKETPPPPNTLRIFAYGPGSPVYPAAGIPKRDWLLGLALARESCRPGFPRQRLLMIEGPFVRAIACLEAVRLVKDASPEEQLAWCERAWETAGQIGEHHQRCLFLADAAETFAAIGAQRRALDVARSTAREIVVGGDSFGAVHRKPAYAHAFGKALLVLARSRQQQEALPLLWSGRCLGAGFLIGLGYLSPVMASFEPQTLDTFREVSRKRLFV